MNRNLLDLMIELKFKINFNVNKIIICLIIKKEYKYNLKVL